MKYTSAENLSDVRFKHSTFELCALFYAKLSLEDLLLATLQYLEYRPYEQVALDFGIHESNLVRHSH